MNWLTNFIRPKIKNSKRKNVPDNLWGKCTKCEKILYLKELKENINICVHCGFHMKISAQERLELIFDPGYEILNDLPKFQDDPLKFKDIKSYLSRLKDARQKNSMHDAILVGIGKIEDEQAVISAFDFNFMGGSMSMAVGEGFAHGCRAALDKKCPYIVVTSSGGARMQEGILSLMQMPKSIAYIEQLNQNNLPYIVVLTNPTTGGTTASLAMLGDFHIAETGATIGFAGARVIENTIKQKLPEGFQTAEYLIDNGIIDIIVTRCELKNKIAKILRIIKQ